MGAHRGPGLPEKGRARPVLQKEVGAQGGGGRVAALRVRLVKLRMMATRPRRAVSAVGDHAAEDGVGRWRPPVVVVVEDIRVDVEGWWWGVKISAVLPCVLRAAPAAALVHAEVGCDGGKGKPLFRRYQPLRSCTRLRPLRCAALPRSYPTPTGWSRLRLRATVRHMGAFNANAASRCKQIPTRLRRAG